MEIHQAVESLRQSLKLNNDFDINLIDLSLPVIPPFRGGGEIKLIILGQDPTIKKVASRKKITCTLNLDKNNSLKRYIEDICTGLGINLDNVYATNLYKYFYTKPPAETMEVLRAHLQPNLELLQQELAEFKNVAIITLGEPVLRLLTDEKTKVRTFWDYNAKTGMSNDHFTFSIANDNKLGREIFPFPHQPSIRKEFYKNALHDYISFMSK
jgi:hypothetical protein